MILMECVDIWIYMIWWIGWVFWLVFLIVREINDNFLIKWIGVWVMELGVGCFFDLIFLFGREIDVVDIVIIYSKFYS